MTANRTRGGRHQLSRRRRLSVGLQSLEPRHLLAATTGDLFTITPNSQHYDDGGILSHQSLGVAELNDSGTAAIDLQSPESGDLVYRLEYDPNASAIYPPPMHTSVGPWINIDPTQPYQLDATTLDLSYAGSHNDSQLAIRYVAIDAEGLSVASIHVRKLAGSIDTTLLQDVNPGDTSIVVADASGWSNDVGSSRQSRALAWYGYEDSAGTLHADYTYTRNVLGGELTGAWPPEGIVPNDGGGFRIHLNEPWAGTAVAAGTAIRNAFSDTDDFELPLQKYDRQKHSRPIEPWTESQSIQVRTTIGGSDWRADLPMQNGLPPGVDRIQIKSSNDLVAATLRSQSLASSDSFFTFSGDDRFVASRSLETIESDLAVAVDLNSEVTLSVVASFAPTADVPDPVDTHTIGYHAFDADGLLIRPEHYSLFLGSVESTLAVDLHPGDTQIVLTDASGWSIGDAGPDTRTLAWYGYRDSNGTTYDDYTYTRNVGGNSIDGLWPLGGIIANTIALNQPWSGPSLEAGTAVRNAVSGDAIHPVLLDSGPLTETPTRLTSAISTYPPGTASIRAAAAFNQSTLEGDDLVVIESFAVGSNLSEVAPDADTHRYSILLDVTANDEVYNSSQVGLTSISDPDHGTVTITDDGLIQYESSNWFVGVDRFSYTIADTQSEQEWTESVTVTIGGMNYLQNEDLVQALADNDAYRSAVRNPLSADDGWYDATPQYYQRYRIITGEELSVHRVGVDDLIENDGFRGYRNDRETNARTVSLLRGTNHGTLSLNPDGTFSYQPADQFVGIDSFQYAGFDGIRTDTATVFIDVVADASDLVLKNLETLGLGLHYFHSAYQRLPTFPTSGLDENRKPYLSWRVYLLPFIGHYELFEQFQLDEPWDSEHNLPLLDQMPDLFGDGIHSDGTTTRIQTLTSPYRDPPHPEYGRLGIPTDRSFAFKDVLDGLSNTIMFVQTGAEKAVPWTAPQDAAFDFEDPLQTLGAIGNEGIPVTLFDARAVVLPTDIDDYTFAHLASPNGFDGPILVDPDRLLRRRAEESGGQAAIEVFDQGGARQDKNLKNLGIAFHNFHSAYRVLPPNPGFGHNDEDGRPNFSWRVALLPFIDEQELYEKFDSDQPWDGPTNLPLLDEMPNIFRSFGDPADSNTTRFQVVNGPGAAYQLDESTGYRATFDDIADGLENTLLLVETGPDKAVLWSKPDAANFDPNDPLSILGAVPDEFFRALMADGSRIRLPADVDGETFRALATRDSAEFYAPDSTHAAERIDGSTLRSKYSAINNDLQSNQYDRMRNIGSATHQFHSEFHRLPIIDQPDFFDDKGKPFLSWRVHLLPFLGQQHLYDQFHLDEPWDSPHNLALLQNMPDVYRSSDDSWDSTATRIQRFTDNGAPFSSTGVGPSFRDFRDGVSNTILYVETGPGVAVPWTQPIDITFDPVNPLSKLGDIGDQLLVIWGDGSISVETELLPDRLANQIRPWDMIELGYRPLSQLTRDQIDSHGELTTIDVRFILDTPNSNYSYYFRDDRQVDVIVADPSVLSVHPTSLTFTEDNWDLTQTFTFQAVADDSRVPRTTTVTVGDQSFQITVGDKHVPELPPPRTDAIFNTIDINDNLGAWTNDGIVFDDKLFFPDYSPETGTELFAYDPAIDSKYLVADINPGPAPSEIGVLNNAPLAPWFIEFDDKLYFSAFHASYGHELWQYDPVSDAATLVADLNPGRVGAYPGQYGGFVEFDGKLFFSAIGDGVGRELFQFDPISNAVTLVSDINPGSGDSDPGRRSQYFVFNDQLYFDAAVPGVGTELWRYDPSDDTTLLVADIDVGSRPSIRGTVTQYTEFQGAMYFTAHDALHGEELRRYDPETGTVSLVVDLYQPPEGHVSKHSRSSAGEASGFVAVGDRLYFASESIEHGQELYQYDAVTESVSIVHDLSPGPDHSMPGRTLWSTISGRHDGLVLIDDVLYFTANPTGLRTSIYRYDTVSGAMSPVSITGDHDPLESVQAPLVAYQNRLYLIAKSGSSILLMQYDPSQESLTTIATYEQPYGSGYHTALFDFRFVNSYVLWVTHSRTGESYLGKYDLATETTSSHVAEIQNGDRDSWVGYYSNYVVRNDLVYFMGNDLDHGRELRQFNTQSGAVTVLEVRPGPDHGTPVPKSNLVEVDDQLYFIGLDYKGLARLHALDLASGSIRIAGSSEQVVELRTNHRSPVLIPIAGKLYFSGATPETGEEIFQYDPATDTISLIADINPGNLDSVFRRDSTFAVLGDDLYFVAIDPENGTRLRHLDTANGSVSLAAAAGEEANIEWTLQANLLAFEGQLFFFSDQQDESDGIFRYDPIARTITRIVNSQTGVPLHVSAGNGMGGFDGNLYFSADGTQRPSQLHQYNVATGTTKNIAENDPTLVNLYVRYGNIYEFDGKILFTGSLNGENGLLFQYDPATDQVSTIVAGDAPVAAAQMDGKAGYFDMDGILYFSGHEPDKGPYLPHRLFQFDPATNAITQVLDVREAHDVAPILDQPPKFFTVADKLYFAAEDRNKGHELIQVTPFDSNQLQLIVDPISATVDESGISSNHFVSLSMPPSSDVVVSVKSNNEDEVTVSPATITFTPLNWNFAKEIVVTGVDDQILADGDTVTTVSLLVEPESSDPAFVGVGTDLEITNRDTTVAQLVLSTSEISVAEDGAGAELTLSLSAQPVDFVYVGLDAGDQERFELSTGGLVFSPQNWNQPQMIGVTAINDSIVQGDEHFDWVAWVIEPSAIEFHGKQSTVSVTVHDDDVAGFTIVESDGDTKVSESGATDSFTVALNAAPPGPVAIDVVSQYPSIADIDSQTLEFDSTNWNKPQTITIKAIDDDLVDGDQTTFLTLAINAEQSDDAFDELDNQSVNVRVEDDDMAGFSIDFDDPIVVAEGDIASDRTISVTLDAAPLTPVTITVTVDDSTAVEIDRGTLLFDSTNWDEPQTVTISAVDDEWVDGDQTTYLTLEIDPEQSDDAFNEEDSESITVRVEDNDIAGFSVDFDDPIVLAEGDSESNRTLSVTLDAAPLTPITISATIDDPNAAGIDRQTLEFDSTNWDQPQIITVSAVDDTVVDGDQTTFLTLAIDGEQSDDAFYEVDSQGVNVRVEDDDVAGFLVVTDGPIVVKEGGFSSFDILLTGAPVGEVRIDVSESSNQIDASPSMILFNKDNWDQPQIVIVSGRPDALAESDSSEAMSISVHADSDAAFTDVPTQTVEAALQDSPVANIEIVVVEGSVIVRDADSGLPIHSHEMSNQDPFVIAVDAAVTIQFDRTWQLSDPKLNDGSFYHQIIQDGGTTVQVKNDRPWQNPFESGDVNRSGHVSALDALRIINFIGTMDTPELPDRNETNLSDDYFDVTGDGEATALDALRVINQLAAASNPSIEGQQPQRAQVHFAGTPNDDDRRGGIGEFYRTFGDDSLF